MPKTRPALHPHQTASGVFTSLLTVLILETTVTAPIAMRFAALFLGNAAVSIAAYCLIPKTQSRQNFRKLKLAGCYVLTFGLPLVLHHASGFVKGQLDRIVIYQHYPAEQLGIYSAGLQLASILSILLLAVNKATVPHYYQALKQGSLNAEKVRKFALFSLIAVPIPTFIAFLLPEKLYVWILGAQYLGVKYYILLFCSDLGSQSYYLLVNFLFYHGENKRIATISVLSTVVYLVALFATSLVGIQWIPLAMIIGNIAILPILYHRVSQHIKAA